MICKNLRIALLATTLAALSLVTPAAPVSGGASATSESLAAAILKLGSEALVAKSVIGICVVDAATSSVLVDINSAMPLKPASCNKLLTTAAGLSLLGTDYCCMTRLYRTGSINRGVLKGDLVVRGGGDPTISGRFEKDKKNVTALMAGWAQKLKARGVRRITGNIVADDRFFDRQYFHELWYPDERGEYYEAEISGLAFNDNCIDLTWSGVGRMPGDKALFTMNPQTAYARVDNQVVISAEGRPSTRTYIRQKGSNDIIVTGTMSVGKTKVDSASIDNGALFFATVFKEVLTSSGITVQGNPVLCGEARGSVNYDKAKLLLTHKSPPLNQIINVINRNSQNFYAECVCKLLGREKAGEGSFSAGTRVIRDWVRSTGIFTAGHEMVDGSGLSAENRVSPRQLVELIRLMDTGPLAGAWRDSLPIGGVRGSLVVRFQETTASQALAPRIMGKTGLIGGVRTLSGIVKTNSNRELYYSIMVNDFRAPAQDVMTFIDETALFLARLD